MHSCELKGGRERERGERERGEREREGERGREREGEREGGERELHIHLHCCRLLGRLLLSIWRRILSSDCQTDNGIG